MKTRTALTILIAICLAWIPVRGQLNCSGGTLNCPGTPTGTGVVVLQTSPTLVTPVLGDATATSIKTSSDSGFGVSGTPSARVEVQAASTSFGNGTGHLNITATTDPNKRVAIGYDTSVGTNGIGWIQSIRLGTANTNLVLQGNGGNLSVGTGNAPLSLLSVNGNGSASYTSYFNGATAIGGTTTNDSAPATFVGEYISSTVASGSAVTLAATSATPVTSISLTAGDWDVTGVVDYIPNAATSITVLSQGSQPLNNCMTSGPALGAQDTFTLWETAANVIGATNPAWALPVTRVSIASTTTVCLIAKATFTVNSLTAYGTIRARRVR